MSRLSLCLALLLMISASCHKTSSVAHRPPTLIGQWKWVQLGTIFTLFYQVIAQGRDSTVILTLNPDSSYSILVNGKTGYSNTFGLNFFTSGAVIDSSLTINNPVAYSFIANKDIPLSGGQIMTISQDTMTLTQFSGNPAGTATVFKFIPYP